MTFYFLTADFYVMQQTYMEQGVDLFILIVLSQDFIERIEQEKYFMLMEKEAL